MPDGMTRLACAWLPTNVAELIWPFAFGPKLTMPVGSAIPDCVGATVAVKVTGVPAKGLRLEDETIVVVVGISTVSDSEFDTLEAA
jgi:hypothetical protein